MIVLIILLVTLQFLVMMRFQETHHAA